MEADRPRRDPLKAAALASAVLLSATACAGASAKGGDLPDFGVRAAAAPGAGRVRTPDGAIDVADLVLRHRGESPVTVLAVTRDVAAEERTPLHRLVPFARPATRGERAILPAGGRTVVLAERFSDGSAPPAPFGVEVSLRGVNEHGFETAGAARGMAGDGGFRDATTLGAPLVGGGWVAENGPSTCSGHRRAIIWRDNRPRCAQRFALDFFREVAPGVTRSATGGGNEAFGAWGGEVVAPVDGTVAAAVDGIPDNEPDPTDRAVPMEEATIAGNHVVLDLGDGAFVMLAHLRRGSVRVKTGDRVRRGDPLGLVGNSGNSTEPHLHLHVADGPSPTDADGIPFVFDRFSSGGRQFDGVLPAEGSVVAFPEKSASTPAPSADAR